MEKPFDRMLGGVYRKEYALLDRLLESEDVNSVDRDGRTVLMYAVLDDEEHPPRMVEYLIQRGADVNVADRVEGWTALHFAARDQKTEIVKLLLDAGAEVDATDAVGSTALWRSLSRSTPETPKIVKLLLARGADPDRKNKSRLSPIDVARRLRAEAAVLALLEGSRKGTEKSQGKSKGSGKQKSKAPTRRGTKRGGK